MWELGIPALYYLFHLIACGACALLGFPLLWAQFVRSQASEYALRLLCAVCVLGCTPLWALLVHSQASEYTL